MFCVWIAVAYSNVMLKHENCCDRVAPQKSFDRIVGAHSLCNEAEDGHRRNEKYQVVELSRRMINI